VPSSVVTVLEVEAAAAERGSIPAAAESVRWAASAAEGALGPAGSGRVDGAPVSVALVLFVSAPGASAGVARCAPDRFCEAAVTSAVVPAGRAAAGAASGRAGAAGVSASGEAPPDAMPAEVAIEATGFGG